MKGLLHKISAVMLAMLVFVSTTSFSVEQHFCGDHLVAVSFFGEAQTCAMEKALAKRSGCESVKSECCEDETLIVEGQDELKIQFDDLTKDQLRFLTTFTYTYIDLFAGLEQHFVPFDGYPPPLIIRDIQKDYQHYLI